MPYTTPIELIASTVFPPSAVPLPAAPPSVMPGDVGPPVLVGRTRDLALALDVTDVIPDPAFSSPTISLDVQIETASSRAASRWRTLGAFPTVTTPGTYALSLTRADAWVRARYIIGNGCSFGFSCSGDATLTGLASAARAVSGVGAAVEIAQYRTVKLCLDVTAASGTSPTLDVTLETAPTSNSTTWRPVDSFSTATATGSEDRRFHSLDRYVRVRWTIGGTGSPSFTFSVAGIAVLVLAAPADRARLGIRGGALFPARTVDDVADALEVGTTMILPYYQRWIMPLRQWGDDTRDACIAAADMTLLRGRGHEPGKPTEAQAYFERFVYYFGNPSTFNVKGWLDRVRLAEITPTDILDSENPQSTDTSPRVLVSSLPPRRWGRRPIDPPSGSSG